MTNLGARLCNEHPYSAARFYGFARTARRIGDVPLSLDSVNTILKKFYVQEMAAILDDTSAASPFLGVFAKPTRR